MNLFDIIEKDIFSLLASKNKRLYFESLTVLWDLYQDRVKIEHKLYLRALVEHLEPQSNLEFFDEEEMNPEERANLRGKASFLIRKLLQKGWIVSEFSTEYERYYTVPDYSSKLLDLFHSLQENQPSRGFSYVYGTYAALKTAQGEGSPEEKVRTLALSYQNTQDLIKLLKSVYHNIKRYVKEQFELEHGNDVLAMYYDDFIKNVSETYIRPLKVRESIPKYRDFIQGTLKIWLEDREVWTAMVEANLIEQQDGDFETSAAEMSRKIHWIIEQYDHLAVDLLDEINRELNRYTRIATQKLKNLSSYDHNTKGDLIYLLQVLAKEETISPQVQDHFQLGTQEFLDVKSLYHRKNPAPKQMKSPLVIESTELSAVDQQQMEALLFRPYGKKEVDSFMQDLFGARQTLQSEDFPFDQEKGYIMSFLSVLYQDDPKCFYNIEYLDGFYQLQPYRIPKMVFTRKESL
ncbi:MAG: DUF5716 family protein [Eubacteriales bacterium]